MTLEVFHPLFALLPPCLDRCKSRSTIGFFLIGILVAAPNSRKERCRLQAKHLWMEVKLNWTVLTDRMYTVAPTGKSREQLHGLLFNRAARGSQKNPYEEKAHRGPDYKEIQAWWEQCQEWMQYYKCQCAPLDQDIKGFPAYFPGQGKVRAEVDAFMEYCAKRWQTREDTYQLKRRRLLPDVRDPPEQEAEVDMKDIL